MMYASEQEFVRDFVMRTRSNYEQLRCGPYNVTQLINSMLGLLIIPKEDSKIVIDDDMISPGLLREMMSDKHIKKNTYNEKLNLNQICRHMRNAVSHNKIEFIDIKEADGTINISELIFNDNNINEEFKMEMKVDLLEQFLLEFSDAICKKDN